MNSPTTAESSMRTQHIHGYLPETQDFEDDLRTHVHLENNTLFPKAVQLNIRFVDLHQK
jgi:iron-sulfur cluster repair protein YtfE (RIC family)